MNMRKYFDKHKVGVFLLMLLLANLGMYRITSLLFESQKDVSLVEERKPSLRYYTGGMQILSYGYAVIDYFHLIGDKQDR
jgi:hypothetical protein